MRSSPRSTPMAAGNRRSLRRWRPGGLPRAGGHDQGRTRAGRHPRQQRRADRARTAPEAERTGCRARSVRESLSILNFPLEAYRRAFEINLFGVYTLTQLVLADMVSHRSRQHRQHLLRRRAHARRRAVHRHARSSVARLRQQQGGARAPDPHGRLRDGRTRRGGQRGAAIAAGRHARGGIRGRRRPRANARHGPLRRCGRAAVLGVARSPRRIDRCTAKTYSTPKGAARGWLGAPYL